MPSRPRSLARAALAALGALTLVAPLALSAQPAAMVADLGNPVLGHIDDWVETNAIVEANGLLYFFQNDGSHGRELWRSDGTPLGTYMVRDLCPGSCGSRFWTHQPMAVLGAHVFFAANDGVHGLELWVTDGTASGTRLVLDLHPGWESSFPSMLTAASGQLVFTARGADGVTALWRSDGTAQGSYRISPAGTSFLNLQAIYPGPGFLYLCDGGAAGNFGLWRSDGSEAGTFLLAPLNCFDMYFEREPQGAVLPNGDLLFSAAGEAGGVELWRSNGSPSGTILLADLRPGPDSSIPRHFAALASEVVFVADGPAFEQVLWRSDGTAPGTTPVALAAGAVPYILPGEFVGDGLRYFFAGKDSAHGLEPWVFDGLTAQLLADVLPGPASSLDEQIFNKAFFVTLDGVLVFSANDGIHGFEIWRSDGTGPGTYRLSDLAPGAGSMAIVMWDGSHRPSVIGDHFYFFEEQSSEGYRLSRTDGTTVGPTVVRSIDNQTSAFEPVARDRGSLLEYARGRDCFAAAGAHLYFEQRRYATFEPDLWVTDGTEAGTQVAFAGAEPSGSLSPCAGLANRLLFFEREGAQPGVRSLDVNGGPADFLQEGSGDGSTLPAFLDSGSGLVFAMTDGLYRSGGTAETTSLIATTPDPLWLAPWGDQVLFGGSALLTTQSESTDPLELTPPFSVLAVHEIAAVGSRIVFVAESVSAGAELWASDGNSGDAVPLADIVPGSGGALARPPGLDRLMDAQSPKLLSLGALAVFSAQTPALGTELWVTDGSSAGTVLLKDIFSGEYPSTPRNLTRLGARIFFTAESELEGLELWTTNGTAAGTTVVKDIAPGPASSIPDDLVVRNGILFFSAWSPDYGRELWRSDGSPGGTVRLTDIAPGPKSSSPQRVSRAGDLLYFTATDQIHGYELWAISDGGTSALFADGFESASTDAWSEVLP
jgi:ELWxxDGT repeat protein